MTKLEIQPGTIYRQRYQIIERLGSGGFGSVYKARDLHAKDAGRYELVAIKYISSEAQYPEEVTRHRLRRQIEHEVHILRENSPMLEFIPNYVDYWPVPQADDQIDHFLVMEFISGRSLQGADKELWTPEAMSDFLSDMLGNLIRLHQYQLYHRDIKPDNIIRRDNGRLCIVDFGFSNQQTSTIVLGLTPEYASPEHFLRDVRVEAQSDLYCLGATAYHLFSGMRPPPANLRAPDDRLQFPPGGRPIPAPIRETIIALMAVDRRARPASATDALRLLRGQQSGTGRLGITQADAESPVRKQAERVTLPLTVTDIHAPAGAFYNSSRQVIGRGRINGLTWGSDGTLTVATALGIYHWPVQAEPTPVEPTHRVGPTLAAARASGSDMLTIAQPRWVMRQHIDNPGQLERIALPAGGSATAAAVAANGQVVATFDEGGVAVWLRRERAFSRAWHQSEIDDCERIVLADNGGLLAILSDGRPQCWRIELTGLARLRLRGLTAEPADIAVSGDGSLLATATADSVQLWNQAGNQVGARALPELRGQPIRRIALDRRGERAAIITGETLALVNLSSPARIWLAHLPLRRPTALAFAPDGRTLAIAGANQLWVWNIAGGGMPEQIWEDDTALQLAFLANVKLLLAVGDRLQSYRLNSGLNLDPATPTLDLQLNAPRGLATIKQGPKHLVALADTSRVHLLQLAQKEWQELSPLPSKAVQMGSITFASESRRLVNVSANGVELWPLDTRHEYREYNVPPPMFELALAAKGAHLATYTGTAVHIMSVTPSSLQTMRTIPVDGYDLTAIALSPDGSLLAIGSDSGIQLIRCDSGRQLDERHGEGVGAQHLRFSSDQRILAAISGAHVRLWRIEESRLISLGHIEGHTEPIYDLAFLSGYKLLATCSADGTIRLWNYETPVP